ncbi:MAG: MFS transporter [Phycisphaerae bacterium]|nr:MFS transporter [Phycisphaerae bacterium]
MRNTAGFQWTQLLALAVIHIVVDMYGGMLPAILPVIQNSFLLSLTAAVAILTVLNLAANTFQILLGHIRPYSRNPLLLPAGLVFTAAICLLAAVKDLPGAFYIALFLALICGFGIAITHPESLRAVYSLDRIPPSVVTSIFLTGGFVGFAGGGWLGAVAVNYFGLKGLYIFLIPPPICLAAIYLFRIRLAVEPKIKPQSTEIRIPFWDVYLMTLPMTLSSTLLISLLPTYLYERGFDLVFGGFSTMIFGFGGAVGSIVFGVVAHKKREMQTAIAILLAGTFLMEGYWFLAGYRSAVWLLFFAGSCVVSAYPLIVTMARHSYGLNLGQRMGFIVGGTWGPASAALIPLGWVADNFGIHWVLRFVFAGYLFSAIIGIYILRKFAHKTLSTRKNEI